MSRETSNALWEDPIPLGELGAEEFYDDDDLEFFDAEDDEDLADFDATALSEEEEAEALQQRHAARQGGEADPHVEGGERLQKVLAHAGVASRRAAEQLMTAGRVSIDGIVVTQVGVRVNPETQEIRVDGHRVLTDSEALTVLLHKPAGVVTTMSDPQGRPTVAEYGERYLRDHADELDNPDSVRLVHVGRLDTDTEGLLLLSNDGELSHRLMHPSYEISKTYIAIVEGQMLPSAARQLRSGIELDDGPVAADKVTIKDAGPAGSIVEITLHSGKNHIVRRMLDGVGHPVTRLARTKLGSLGLGGLKPGQMRALSRTELQSLYEEVGL